MRLNLCKTNMFKDITACKQVALLQIAYLVLHSTVATDGGQIVIHDFNGSRSFLSKYSR